jgi:2-alkenal reductase
MELRTMTGNQSSPIWSSVVSRVGHRFVPLVAAMAALMLIAFGAVQAVDAGSNPQEYKVSLVSQTATEEPAPADSEELSSVADVAEAANPAVVTIYTFIDAGTLEDGLKPVDPSGQQEPADPDEPTPLGAGSGWIYSADGYVVTNAHVVQGADSFVVQYHDGTQVEAELIGTDVFQDVAVLKLNLEGDEVPGVATVGDSSQMRPGDEVVAIGSPLGEFTNSVSDGNIGGVDRSLEVGDGTSLDNLIQHDAEISPGNSGGPLLNLNGEVIGMNVAKVETTASNGATASGLNFAIDGNAVVERVDQIIENGGPVEYPYLGIQTQLTEAGQVVVAVEPDGPAAESGIQRGDILTGIDGTPVDEENSFMDLLLGHEPGETVTVTVERNGSTEDLDVTLGVRPDNI